MRTYLFFQIAIFFLASSLYAKASFTYNPTVTISKTNDVVDYSFQNAGAGTHVFTIFGDGTCSNLNSPTHKFAPDPQGYVSEVYFVKPYQTNPPTLRTINTGNITTGTSLFVNPTMNVNGEIDVKTSWSTSYNGTTFFIVAFKNETGTGSVDGNVELHYNSNDLVVDFFGIKEYNNWVYNRTTSVTTGTYDRKIEWNFSNLGVGETRFIYVPAQVFVHVGGFVNLSGKYHVNNIGGDPVVDNASFLSRQYPHDPNFKIVNRNCLVDGVNAHHLEYTIGFFNDGNGFAQTVEVRDELSNLLDPGSVYLIDSEHPVQWNVQNSVLEFVFPGINLPGTNQLSPRTYSYDEAFTYVTFGVCTSAGLPIGTCIYNEANITFDQEPMFATSAAAICYQTDCNDYESCTTARSGGQEIESAKESETALKIYPNPVEDFIHIVVDGEQEPFSSLNIEIRDYSGKHIRQLLQTQYGKEVGELDQSFYIGDLPKGIYLLVVNRGGVVNTQKIVKL